MEKNIKDKENPNVKDRINKTIHKKIQLWTGNPEGEYAIRLLIDSADDDTIDFLAMTNPDTKYERIVAEMDAMDDLRYGWDHVLKEFIANYQRARLVEMDLLSPLNGTPNGLFGEFHTDHKYNIKLILYYACSYCNREFYSEQEKKDHVLSQHV